jgi:hypothetical protein
MSFYRGRIFTKIHQFSSDWFFSFIRKNTVLRTIHLHFSNIISRIKQYIVNASIKLNSKDNIINADVQVIHEETRSTNATTEFSDKENKKCLFPILKTGSFKKTKIGNSTQNSVSDELDDFLKEDNMDSDLIFKKIQFISIS